MKHKTRAAVALSVASVMACGLLAGCDLVTTDARRDYEQVIAEVNIAGTEQFEKEFGSSYKEVIQTEKIYKRDMVASFVASGSNAMSQYGWSYRDTFNAIKDSLINRQVYVQYAKMFIITAERNGQPLFLDAEGKPYTKEGYVKSMQGDGDELDKTIAGLAYFLTEDESGKAQYDLRVSFNNSLDSIEEGIIDAEEEEGSGVTARTTPTGVDTENEDYYDPDYRIYSGTEKNYGTYERVDNSTAYTRKQAYATFLTNIRSSGLLNAGENTTQVEGLSYYKRELKSAYETALINKMADSFEDLAADDVDDTFLLEKFTSILDNQEKGFKAETLDIDSALDGMSDTSFVLTAPQEGYGFVINILLPFSAKDTQDLGDINMDKNDPHGNKFAARAKILQRVRATDQRGTWFTGDTDYSYDAAEVDGIYNAAPAGIKETRSNYLFFENSLAADKSGEGNRYEKLENYYGKYSYNGTVTKDDDGKYTVKPFKIDIDQFIAEMEGYLGQEGVATSTVTAKKANYYTQTDFYDAEEPNKVNYESFVYYAGRVNFENGFDAGEIFHAGSEENKVFSIIRELSFAYNTDTAGLNTYLGYAVTPKKTDFVSEFEYAAQQVCMAGAGNYIVVPSDYGWHIIYCTFSFTGDNMKPFGEAYDLAKKDEEGTFANLFYESQKTAALNSYASNQQTEIINNYAADSATVYEDRYEDLSSLDEN